jgi:hypothetical protein
MYPAGHPQLRRSIERAFEAYDAGMTLSGADELSLLVVDDQLVIDRRPVPEDANWRRGLLQAFERHGLGGLTLRSGLTLEELERFVDSCFSAGGAQASRHLLFGRARASESSGLAPGGGGAAGGGPGSGGPGAIGAAEVEGAGQELAGLADGRLSRLERLRGLIARLARAAAGTRLDTSALQGGDVADRELRHGIEVALGSIRLGRALGASSDLLEELGSAGLLHDIGHLDRIEGESVDERRRRHTIRGALRLAGVEGLPESTVLAAYEHHLRWDLSENYPKLSASRRPAGPARIVAVADTWATLRGHAGASPAEAAAILRDRAGTFLDPDLVRLFLVGLDPG